MHTQSEKNHLQAALSLYLTVTGLKDTALRFSMVLVVIVPYDQRRIINEIKYMGHGSQVSGCS